MVRIGRGARQLALSGTALAAVMFLAAPAWAQAAPDAPAAVDEATTVEEIVVTGSSIRGVPPTGSNLISVTREEIRAVVDSGPMTGGCSRQSCT